MTGIKIVALSNNLKAALTNGVWLCAAAVAAPRGFSVKIALFSGFQLINFDVNAYPPNIRNRVRTAITAASEVIVAGPGYVHRITSRFNNGLTRFTHNPLLLLKIVPRAIQASAALYQPLAKTNASIAGSSLADHQSSQFIKQDAGHVARI